MNLAAESAQQLSRKLTEERQVELGAEQVRRILKKTRAAKLAREAVPQELPSKVRDFDGI